MSVALRRPPRRLSSGERRDRILVAAKAVFGSLGYHGATTREIAAAAEVSEALLYQHFPTKRQLFEAVITRGAEDLSGRLKEAQASDERVTAAVTAFFDFVEEEVALYRVFFHQALQADPEFQVLYLRLARSFADLVAGGLGNSTTSPHAELVAHGLVGMVGELARWWIEHQELPKAEMVDCAARMTRAVYSEVLPNAG